MDAELQQPSSTRHDMPDLGSGMLGTVRRLVSEGVPFLTGYPSFGGQVAIVAALALVLSKGIGQRLTATLVELVIGSIMILSVMGAVTRPKRRDRFQATILVAVFLLAAAVVIVPIMTIGTHLLHAR